MIVPKWLHTIIGKWLYKRILSVSIHANGNIVLLLGWGYRASWAFVKTPTIPEVLK